MNQATGRVFGDARLRWCLPTCVLSADRYRPLGMINGDQRAQLRTGAVSLDEGPALAAELVGFGKVDLDGPGNVRGVRPALKQPCAPALLQLIRRQGKNPSKPVLLSTPNWRSPDSREVMPFSFEIVDDKS